MRVGFDRFGSIVSFFWIVIVKLEPAGPEAAVNGRSSGPFFFI